MNFFEHQAQARGKSRRLVLLFLLAIAAIVAALVGTAVALLVVGQEGHTAAMVLDQHGTGLLLLALGTLALIGIASLYKTASLRSGGGAVARALGGVKVTQDARDPRLRRLRNVVEEIAIASGTPVPEIYVLEQEQGINAFAAGWSPADAAVAVTRGTLEKLNRDELQGVIAHEFSHVLNGDMRLNIRLMGLLFGILVIAIIGREVFEATSRGRSSSKKDGGAIVLAALAVMVIGYIGLFFGRLIKAGVSRSREYLADSSAVQFTRQTTGIAGALKKIAGIGTGSRLQSAKGEEVAHMLFGDGVGYSALFATHPPLLERIRKLEPQFRPAQLKEQAQTWNVPGYLADDPSSPAQLTSGMASAAQPFSVEHVAEQVAHPSAEDYRHAEAVHAAIPHALLEMAGDANQGWLLLLALLLDERAEIRSKQRGEVAATFGEAQAEIMMRGHALLLDLPHAQRLPLAALAFPALRPLPREQLERFLQSVGRLIQADGQVALFEFCLGTLLRTQVADLLYPARAEMVGTQRLGHLRKEALSLLAVLAQQGHPQERTARHAFNAGVSHLFPQASEPYSPPARPTAALAAALRALDKLNAPGKQLMVEAMVKTLSHDHRVTVGEGELLRTVCGVLHCPLPPLAG